MYAEFDTDGHLVRTAPGPATLALPGFVNAHSHAFQRALRGRVERRSVEHQNDDFWAWRNTMYHDAARLTPDDVRALATWAYSDMVRSGFVAVGEFHYLHHDENGAPYATPAMSHAIVAAARDVGIALTLLETAYLRGGFEQPLQPQQRRFAFADSDAFLRHLDGVRASVRGVVVGVALHSVRACPKDAIVAIAAACAADGTLLHVHACEQPAEVLACQREHGMTPIALLQQCGALTPRTTVVHATHLSDADVVLLARSGATVCLTPSTERNLGDGLCRIADLHNARVPLCIGSDSHARIDAIDELRSVEDHERLRLMRRNVLVAPGARLGPALVPIGTRAGAASLGIRLDRSRVVCAAGLEAQTGGATAFEDGLDGLFVGGCASDITDVDDCGGQPLLRGGELTRVDSAEVNTRALAVLKRLSV